MWNEENLIKVLKEGGVAVMPTDTLYGIVGSALNRDTVERIYNIRKRSPDKRCIVLISDIADLEKFSINLSPKQKNLLREYWSSDSESPYDKRGAVSIVLPCPDDNFSYLHCGTNTLAFRIPTDEDLRYLLALTGPLVAPSANPESLEPATTIAEAKAYFGDQVDLYVDGGRISGKASKVIRLQDNGAIEVLRP